MRNVAEDLGVGSLAGVDISLLVSIVLAALLYVAFLVAFPEPRSAYGPQGPRWFATADAPEQPIVARDGGAR